MWEISRLSISTMAHSLSRSSRRSVMQTVDERPETIHLYVVREEEPRPSFFPIVLSVISSLCLGSCWYCFPLSAAGARSCYSRSGCLPPFESLYHISTHHSNRSENLSGNDRPWRFDDYQRLYYFPDTSEGNDYWERCS